MPITKEYISKIITDTVILILSTLINFFLIILQFLFKFMNRVSPEINGTINHGETGGKRTESRFKISQRTWFE